MTCDDEIYSAVCCPFSHVLDVVTLSTVYQTDGVDGRAG